MPLALKPLGTRLVARVFTTPPRIGMIYIPESARKNLLTARVEAVGPDVQWLQPGELVIYAAHSGLLVDEAENLIMLKDEDVLGRVENVSE
jgi:co-chaperonin GroES (HSP10)